MTEHEHSQLRRSLIEQFNRMRNEELTPIPEEFRHLVPNDRWAEGF
ncbi:MAG TPA: hypothetical protein VHT30_00050 [Acidimicrobiales bacterium]|jgi:hypothetical protein|nr:hypothetical protein [Acidimicrobiales bacterium]